MERYKSTLATAAVAAFGLVAAAHILHPGNYEDLPRHVRNPIAAVEGPISTMAWVDPPARASALDALSNAVITTAQAAEGRPIAPQLIASELAASKPVASLAPASPEQLRKFVAPRRHKMAQRRTHMRQASLTRSAPKSPAIDEQVPALEAAPKVADRFDPIGSLLHGLGLDS